MAAASTIGKTPSANGGGAPQKSLPVWAQVSLMLGVVTATTAIYAQVFIPMTLEKIWPRVEDRFKQHDAWPHRDSVHRREFDELRAAIFQRLDRIETKIERLGR